MEAAQNGDNIYREALYVGSFHVEDTDQNSRIKKVRDELETLHVFNKSKKVVICISVRGIKICSPNREVVFMAHALRRVSYVTCDAAHKQVAFLAREPSGEANSQYCHVFVTITSFQAEELNRIIGDAFQLAYVRQRMLKLQRNGTETLPTELQSIPRLCDRYTPCIQQSTTETLPNTDRSNDGNFVSSPATVLPLLLELPPPPSCPPPPPKEMDPNKQLSHCSSSPELTAGPNAAMSTGTEGSKDPTGCDQPITNGLSPTRKRVSEPSSCRTGPWTAVTNVNGHGDQNQSTEASNTNNHSGDDKCSGSSDLESRLQQISTPHVTDMAFLRRHFLRRSEGKRLSTVADAQLIGGSTRQPRRRAGSGLSSLFSQARHSAFFPSTSTNISDPVEVEKPRRDKSNAHAQSVDWLSRLETPSAAQKTHIFVDLRTFAGGSPVVALKERLDAQAVADAKASAFAEAAAVLAAAKLASESSNPSCANSNGNVNATSCKSPGRNPSASRDARPIFSSPKTISDSTFFSSDSGGSGGNRDCSKQPETNLAGELESPPIPPVRLHSLGRGPHRPLPQTPGSGGGDGGKQFSVRGGFHLDTTCTCLSEEDVTGGGAPDLCHVTTSESTASSPGGRVLSNGHVQDHLAAPCLPARSSATSSSSFFSGILQQTSNFSESHRPGGKGPAFAVSDRRVRNVDRPDSRRFSHGPHSPTSGLLESGSQWTTVRNPPHRSHEHALFPESVPGPLHVIAEGCVSHQPWPVGPFVPDSNGVPAVSAAPNMSASTISASTISAETPTPTATPTPTPSQTPQLFGSHAAISREDCEFLRHAPWYQALLPRELAFELLAREDVGSFIVRNSATHPDCCALSVRVPQQNNPTGIIHYLIQRTQNGVRLKGLDKEWPSLRALITHLTVIPEMLPCLLRMPIHSRNPVFTQLDEPRCDWDIVPTVQRGSSQDARSHRVGTGVANLQPVTSLPSRPVPPACASRSYLTSSSSVIDASTSSGNRRLVAEQSDNHEVRSHSIQFSETRSDLNPVDIIKRKSHSLGTKTQCVGEDDSEALCKYDEAICMPQTEKLRTHSLRNQGGSADAECWSRSDAVSPFQHDDDEEDEDYQRLSDFSSMMADLKPTRDTEVTSC